MKTPKEVVESVGGYYVENAGNPRYRIIKGAWVHSVPAGETEIHALAKDCRCKPSVHDGWGRFIDHQHLGLMPNPLPHTPLPVMNPQRHSDGAAF